MSNREAVGVEGENEHGFHSPCSHACVHVCLGEKKRKREKMLEVGDDSRLIEEFFRNVMCGRGSKHWGTLREK